MTDQIDRQVMNAETVKRALNRLATEIVEREEGVADLVLVGIQRGGVNLAQRLGRLLQSMEDIEIPQGTVDITLYRDDALEGLPRPVIGPTRLPFRLARKKVVLVDDVLFTGRTTRAALDALNDYGRPKRVRAAVLVDRGHRELPIQADYVGLRLETAMADDVVVDVAATPSASDEVIVRAGRGE